MTRSLGAALPAPLEERLSQRDLPRLLGHALPARFTETVTVPTLVMDGGVSPAWMRLPTAAGESPSPAWISARTRLPSSRSGSGDIARPLPTQR